MKKKKTLFKLRYKVAVLVLFVSLLSVGALGTFTFITARRHIHEIVDIKYMGHVNEITEAMKIYLSGTELVRVVYDGKKVRLNSRPCNSGPGQGLRAVVNTRRRQPWTESF